MSCLFGDTRGTDLPNYFVLNCSDFMQHVVQLLDPSYGLGRQQDVHEFFVRLFQYCVEKLPAVMPAVLQDQFENVVFQEVIFQR